MLNNKDSKKPEAQIEKDQGIELEEDLEKYANGKIEELTNKVEALKKEWQEVGGLEGDIARIDNFLELFKKEVVEIQKEKEGITAKVDISESFYQHNTKIDEIQNKEAIETTETPIESEKNNLRRSVENILIKFNEKINGLTVIESIKKDIEVSFKETKEEYESILADSTINDEEKENKIKSLTNIFGDYLHYEEKERIIEEESLEESKVEVTMAEPISDKVKSTVELDDTNIDEIPETSDKPERPKVEVTMAEPISESEDKDDRNILRRFGDKLIDSGIKAKDVLSTSAGRKMVAKGLYDTSTTILGIKFATDIALAVAGKGDVCNYFKQKRTSKAEKKAIMEIINNQEIEDRRAACIEKIKSSENLSNEEKFEFLSVLDKIMAEHRVSEGQINSERDKKIEQATEEYESLMQQINFERDKKIEQATEAYFQNKIKAAKISKDALYLALTVATFGSGTLVTRAGAYGLSRASTYFMAAGIERAQKANQQFDKDEVNSEVEGKNRINEIVKDVFVNSTRETFRSLRGKGKTEDSEHKTMDRVQALGNIARAVGIVITNVDIQDLGVTGEELSELKDNILENLEKEFDNVVEAGENLVETVEESELAADVKEFVASNNSLKEVTANITKAGENLADKAGEITTDVLGEEVVADLKNLGDSFGDRVSEEIDQAKESKFVANAKEVGENLLDKAEDTATDILGEEGVADVKEAVADVKEFVASNDSLKEVTDNITNAAEGAFSAAGDTVTNVLGEEVVADLKDVRDGLADRGEYLANEVKEGEAVAAAKAFAASAGDSLKDLNTNIAETTKDALDNLSDKANDVLGRDIISGEESNIETSETEPLGSEEQAVDTESSEILEIPEEEPNVEAKVDIIDSSEVNGSDSIWKSARTIFERNPSDFGFDGDSSDLEAVSKWAETQTANAIAVLSQEQGGDLADLVHDGDKVILEMIDGKPHLSFEASSGIEAGHLPVVESLEEPIVDANEDGIPEPTPAGKIHMSSDLTDSSELDSPKTEEIPVENTSDLSEGEKLEGNHILKSELPNNVKSIPLVVEKFMKEHNISFKDGNLIGLKNIDKVSFDTVGQLGDERSVDFLHFFENDDGSIRAEITGDDKTDIFKINQDGEWSNITERESADTPTESSLDKTTEVENISSEKFDFDNVNEKYQNEEDMVELRKLVFQLEKTIDNNQSVFDTATEEASTAAEEANTAAEEASTAAEEFEKYKATEEAGLKQYNADNKAGIAKTLQETLGDSKKELADIQQKAASGNLGTIRVAGDGSEHNFDILPLKEGQIGYVETSDGYKVRFVYNEEGDVEGTFLKKSGVENYKLLDEFKDKIEEALSDKDKNFVYNIKGDATEQISGLRDTQHLLENMKNSGQGDTPEAKYLVQSINSQLKEIDSRFPYLSESIKNEISHDLNVPENQAETINNEEIDDLINDSEIEEGEAKLGLENDLNNNKKALSILSEALSRQMPDLHLDNLEDINSVENAEDLLAIKKALESFVDRASNDPAQSNLVTGFKSVLEVVDTRIIELGDIKTVLSDISTVVSGSNLESLDQIRALDNVDNLEALKKVLSGVIAQAEAKGITEAGMVQGHKAILEVINQTLDKKA